MEKYTIDKAIKVFGLAVKTFPLGIDKAFNELIRTIGDQAGERSYYGISFFENGTIIYLAAAEEKNGNEPSKFGYESYTIEAGDYVASTVHNWNENKECIKDVCHEVVMDPASDKTKPCIEWYKNKNDLTVMVKMK